MDLELERKTINKVTKKEDEKKPKKTLNQIFILNKSKKKNKKRSKY